MLVCVQYNAIQYTAAHHYLIGCKPRCDVCTFSSYLARMFSSSEIHIHSIYYNDTIDNALEMFYFVMAKVFRRFLFLLCDSSYLFWLLDVEGNSNRMFIMMNVDLCRAVIF